MTLSELNTCPAPQAHDALFKCCGSDGWVKKMLSQRPFPNEAALFETAKTTWDDCKKEDWLEAFSHHPRIGDLKSLEKKFATTGSWAKGEQAGTTTANAETLKNLQTGNKEYEDKFGYIFLVCATGKTADEMLSILNSRLPNHPSDEMVIAKKEQAKITEIRLRKLLSEG